MSTLGKASSGIPEPRIIRLPKPSVSPELLELQRDAAKVTNHSAPAPLAFPLPSNSPTKTIAYGDGTSEAYEPYKTCHEDYGKFVTPKPREPFKPPKSSL
mmetsp:Transcript_16211/g.32343  ORF Transcript_16211/g.32343 Transcript_16211/m.32343 type:complete len:100 (-) Transcript_16211:73-372(-)